MRNVPEKRGMPIYIDETQRSISDALDGMDIDAWFPSNSAAQKLWRCLECLKDLDDILVGAENLKNATKRKRKLKIALTPLHSLVKSIDDLCNDIHSNKETSRQLASSKIKDVIEIQRLFSDVLPHDHKADISMVRNKLSAHIDKKMNPLEAQKISELIMPHEFGRWLHLCLHVVVDLTKLDIYHWSCKSPSHEYVRFMHNEPFIVTIKIDGEKPIALAALNIANNSPKNDISEVIDRLIQHSQWMFKKNQPRIMGLKDYNDPNVNSFREYAQAYKQLLS